MAVTVRIPTVLRKLAGDQEALDASGSTVGEVLREVGDRFPEFLGRITEPDGTLRQFLNVYVNGQNIRLEREMDTAVGDGDEIFIAPSIAGGRP